MRDAAKSYTGETRFPFLLQNIHRYFFYLSLVILAFLWWDSTLAFRFPDGFGWASARSCCSSMPPCCRCLVFPATHAGVCGGYLNSFHSAPGKYKTWTFISKLNEKHMEFAWVSLIWVGLTDVYVRLLAMG